MRWSCDFPKLQGVPESPEPIRQLILGVGYQSSNLIDRKCEISTLCIIAMPASLAASARLLSAM